MSKRLTEILNIQYPIIMAPMFLVSNEEMLISALENGITGAIPAANYKHVAELKQAILSIKDKTSQPFGINLIVHKSNPLFQKQLQVVLETQVAFVISSLGNPSLLIEKCHDRGIKVFCDVTDMYQAEKVVGLGSDALIAVNKDAGGHPGKLEGSSFVQDLINKFHLPVIYAGGLSDGKTLREVMNLGVAGVSIGTLFLASQEAPISQEYKDAIIKFGASDIVKTDKLSGTELHVINTDYVKKVGTSAGFLQRFLYRHKNLRRLLKQMAMKRGMNLLRKAAFSVTYKNVWVAGKAIEHIHEIKPISQHIQELTKDVKNA
jgi:nitronate monooxygenase